MCVCVYVCVCMSVCVRRYACVCVCTYVCIHTYTQTHTQYLHLHVICRWPVHTHIGRQTHVHMCIRTQHTEIHTRHKRVHRQTDTHTYTHGHTHRHIHTHTQHTHTYNIRTYKNQHLILVASALLVMPSLTHYPSNGTVQNHHHYLSSLITQLASF